MTIQTKKLRLNTDANVLLKVERPFYEQHQFNNDLSYCNPEDDRMQSCSQWMCNFKLSSVFRSVFPIYTWMSQYSMKTDLIGDAISGCTVAIMHIPQGMGYAMLANIPPIIGIYTAFFPVLIYFIFGTSKHNSMGTFAVISIMVSKSVLKYGRNDAITIHTMDNQTVGGAENEGVWQFDYMPLYTPMQVVSSLSLVVGVIHLIMYVLRLGVISSLLSETLVSGFTTGAAIHVFTSQVKDLLGIELSPNVGNFKIIFNFYEIFNKIGDANATAVCISAIAIVVLYLNNEWMKPKWSRISIIPVPIELILLIIFTLASRFLDLSTNYGIRTIGTIPTGFPAFELPDLNLAKELIVDGFVISMVSYTISVSMALIFAQKLSYEINFNQELLAMGASNVFGSFFTCLPLSASLSRSAIQQSTGGRTQIASLISCGLLTFVLLWIGPFFELLPKCVLASIIVVALKGMLVQVKQCVEFWKLSRLDAIVWLGTFLTVIIVSIDIGLLVGILLSLACIFIRSNRPYVCLLGHVPKTDLYIDVKRYKAAKEISSIKIFHYCGSLNFATRSLFKSELCSLIRLDLANEMQRNQTALSSSSSSSIQLKCLIIDFSALSYIDSSGVCALKLLISDFNKLCINVYIAGASCPAYEFMKKCGLNEKCDGSFNFYPTVHDAVHQALDNNVAISVTVVTETS